MSLEHALVAALACIGVAAPWSSARAWGDEGHEIVGEIATHFLTPTARTKAFALLAADQDPLTAHDFVHETTWADHFRDSDRDTTKVHYLQTHLWHFVDIEIADGDVDRACYGHPALPPATVASLGPASDCAIDKIAEFEAELASPRTSASERLLALKFLLHFVGDIHQPLHASDDHDAGGNLKSVTAAGLGSGTLHGFFDTPFVQRLGADPVAVGDALARRITAADVAAWSSGTPTQWAVESFGIAKARIYAKLPAPTNGTYALPAAFVAAAQGIVTGQLSRAGVRLAAVLNAALASP